MPKTQTSCPRCRQPVVAEIEQLFDAGADPQAKQRLLSGQFNLIQCQNCGYQGNLSTPLVYHDPNKELLLTYFPAELGLPVTEQEKLIGPMIKRVVDRLPAEKRKAYLLRPASMLTMQTMLDRILEADGITREMVEGQQKRIALMQRLINTPPESRAEIIQQEEALFDESFFGILSRLVEVSLQQGDQNLARALAGLQKELVEQTEFGRKLKAQSEETEAAVKALQDAAQQGLTREKLMELIVNAPSEIQMTTIVGMARSGLDYEFFALLTQHIEAADGEQKEKLTALRDKLLEMTKQIDQAIQQEMARANSLLQQLLAAPDIEKAAEQSLPAFDELFLQVVQDAMTKARQKADLDQIGKLQKIVNVIQKASAPPAEVQALNNFLNDLVDAADDEARLKVMQNHAEMITPDFLSLVNSLANSEGDEAQPPEIREQLKKVYKSALRFSMQANLQK